MEDLEEKIKEAWGYDEYYQKEYDSIQEYFEEEFYKTDHETARDKYSKAAYLLEDLVRDVCNKNS